MTALQYVSPGCNSCANAAQTRCTPDLISEIQFNCAPVNVMRSAIVINNMTRFPLLSTFECHGHNANNATVRTNDWKSSRIHNIGKVRSNRILSLR